MPDEGRTTVRLDGPDWEAEMESLAGALVLIFILWLIDKHSRWRTALKIVAWMAAAGIVGCAIIYGWVAYKDHEQRKAQTIDLSAGFVPKEAVDCYDKDGHLVPDPFGQYGGVTLGCAPGEIQVPKGTLLKVIPSK